MTDTDERVQRYAEAVENAVLPARVRQVMAVADAEQAELRAEVEHWKGHAEEAGLGFSRVCKDFARVSARNVALVDRAEAAERALAGERAKASDLTSMVREMHEHLGAHVNYGPPGTDIPEDLRDIRIALLDEEVGEYRDAAKAGDLVGIADGLADLVYVAYGTAHTYGIPLDAVLAEVHRSNMTKQPNPDGGKFTKGSDFSPADVSGVLRAVLAGPAEPDTTEGGA